jgi:hypothetical protein
VANVQSTVGMKVGGRTDHTVVDADDALIAALKVKMQRPEAEILYVRRVNKRETRGTRRAHSRSCGTGEEKRNARYHPGWQWRANAGTAHP